MQITEQQKHSFWEFMRYCVVGGVAFLFETGTHLLLWQFILKSETPLNTFIATAVGFIIGTIVNYILSILWVFTTKTQQKQGKTVKAFVVFAVVGIIGLGFKELLMFLGAIISGVPLATFGSKPIPYYITHIISTGIVLIWNYIGRKIFVFKKEQN